MSKELDRSKPYSEVQGDSRAAFYQGGRYFRADYTEISTEEASKPSESGSFISQVEARVAEERSKENSEKPLTLIDENNPSTNSPADIAAAKKRVADAKAAKDTPVVDPKDAAEKTRSDLLSDMHVTELRSLVKAAGGEPPTGRGSKAKAIEWLLENTE